MLLKRKSETISLEERILRNPEQFSFMHIMRLFGRLRKDYNKPALQYLSENVYIRPWLSLAFPSSEISSAKVTERNIYGVPKYEVTATLFGLYSTMGSLPTFYTDELLEEERGDESVSRDFLDIFNNYLYHLFYAVLYHNEMVVRILEDHDEAPSHLIFSLCGEPFGQMRHRQIPRLRFVELLSKRSRSAGNLTLYLSLLLNRNDIFVEECAERNVPVPEEQRCRIGRSCATLGEDAVLGQQVRDATGKFRIHFQNASESEISEFLPKKEKYSFLKKTVDSFLDTPLKFDLVMHNLEETYSRKIGVNAEMGFFIGKETRHAPVTISWS